ncbi:MAG: glycosyltransferase family protein [Limisphaerales bacterium]
MARIFLSLSGEGRGHATRARAVVESLRERHEISLFASGDAWRFLAPLYRDTPVQVHRIGGLRFHYTETRRLNFSRTGAEALRFLRRLPMLVGMLERQIQRGRPDLVVTDFEPALPRAARRCGVPFLSLDHQHFLLTYDLSGLPPALRLHAAYMALIVRAYCSGQAETIVSSFYFPRLRQGCHQVTQVGVMLRPEVLAARPERAGHLVAYFRRFGGDHLLAALQASGRAVRVYGLGARPAAGRLTFHDIEERRFVEDLAACDALVSTAGNQLVGEALHLGKPVLALPEARNFEQYINAHFLAQSGAGAWREAEKLTPADVTAFLGRLGNFCPSPDAARIHGLPATLEVIRRHLPAAKPATHSLPRHDEVPLAAR